VQGELWGERGFTEIRSFTRLTPDLVVGGKKRKVWAIVREAIEPVFKEYTARELGERGRGTMRLTSPYTNELLGYGSPESPTALRQGTPKQVDFAEGMDALFDYRELSTLWHLLGQHRLGSVERFRLGSLSAHFGLGSRDEVANRIGRVLNHFRGPHMGPLGESLEMLAHHDIFLRDVHSMNIGWHVSRGDEDWTYVVIFDPGHTPTAETEIETALIENGRSAL